MNFRKGLLVGLGLALLAMPAMAQRYSGGGGSGGAGATTGRIETPMVISAGNTLTGMVSGWLFYPHTSSVSLAAGQHITVSMTAFLDGISASMHCGLLDTNGHGYMAEWSNNSFASYKSNSATTNTLLSGSAPAFATGWYTLTLDLWPAASQQYLVVTVQGGGATYSTGFKFDSTYPISGGPFFPVTNAINTSGAQTFSNIRSGWFAVDR